jgi:outer membrane protein TolC
MAKFLPLLGLPLIISQRRLRDEGDEMKLQLPKSSRQADLPAPLTIALLLIPILMITIATRSEAEPLPLERAIRLALAHSTTSAIAGADVQHAFASYHELQNDYLPQLYAGSGLGWTYGYPLTIDGAPPALVNVIARSTVFNPAQRQFINAAKTDWLATESQNKDQRNAVIQDVVLSYAELAKWEARQARLQQDEAQTQQIEQAVTERVQEGVDSGVDLNKAKLTAARVRLRRIEARGSADVLRQHLANMTGLPASSIETAPETIPVLPTVSEQEDLSAKAVAASPAIKFAEQHSLAEAMRASGEHRSLLPSVDFSAQYARFSTFNNYTEYFPNHFQQDNATVGFGLRIPIFNASQQARATAAEAEALKAKKRAEAVRNQVSEDTLKLQRSAEQLEAAREVAQLEYQLAQSSLEAVQTRIDAKTGTLHELADAQVQEEERYLLFQDANFEYQRARLNLLRATGDLEKWALSIPTSK